MDMLSYKNSCDPRNVSLSHCLPSQLDSVSLVCRLPWLKVIFHTIFGRCYGVGVKKFEMKFSMGIPADMKF